MMFSLLPSGPPSEDHTQDTFRILSLIAHPEAAKKRLEELTAIHSDIVDRHGAAVDAEKTATDAINQLEAYKASFYADFEREKQSFVSERDSFIELKDKKISELAKKEQDLNFKSKDLTELEASLQQRSLAVVDKENDLSSRHNAMTQQEADVRKSWIEVDTLKTVLEKRIKALKSAIEE